MLHSRLLRLACLFLACVLSPLAARAAPGEAVITFTFVGMKSVSGALHVELACEPKTGGAFKRGTVAAVRAVPVVVEFRAVPLGACRAQIFRDLNGDGVLNTGAMGIPREPYAFSNNARGRFGPPSQAATLFTVERDVAQQLRID